MCTRLITLALVSALTVSAVFAAETRAFTGNDYLRLTNKGRLDAVTALINDAKAGGVKIRKTPVSYCKKLDALYLSDPAMRDKPLATVLKTLIIMEYDWAEKGVNKEKLARQWLGDNVYEQNKARFGR